VAALREHSGNRACSERDSPAPHTPEAPITGLGRRPNSKTPAHEDRGKNGFHASRCVASPSQLSSAHGRSSEIQVRPVRLLWPQIKETVAAGHKLRQIWECLNEDGIHLSYAKFRYYVARLRRTDMSGQPARQSQATAPDQKVDPQIPAHDPLANLRKRMNKRPGFQFDESPPDIKKLI
jgi:hypothetical protein